MKNRKAELSPQLIKCSMCNERFPNLRAKDNHESIIHNQRIESKKGNK